MPKYEAQEEAQEDVHEEVQEEAQEEAMRKPRRMSRRMSRRRSMRLDSHRILAPCLFCTRRDTNRKTPNRGISASAYLAATLIITIAF